MKFTPASIGIIASFALSLVPTASAMASWDGYKVVKNKWAQPDQTCIGLSQEVTDEDRYPKLEFFKCDAESVVKLKLDGEGHIWYKDVKTGDELCFADRTEPFPMYTVKLTKPKDTNADCMAFELEATLDGPDEDEAYIKWKGNSRYMTPNCYCGYNHQDKPTEGRWVQLWHNSFKTDERMKVCRDKYTWTFEDL